MTTRNVVVELRTAHPSWTMVDIARSIGITPERVRQILKTEGLPTFRVPDGWELKKKGE